MIFFLFLFFLSGRGIRCKSSRKLYDIYNVNSNCVIPQSSIRCNYFREVLKGITRSEQPWVPTLGKIPGTDIVRKIEVLIPGRDSNRNWAISATNVGLHPDSVFSSNSSFNYCNNSCLYGRIVPAVCGLAWFCHWSVEKLDPSVKFSVFKNAIFHWNTAKLLFCAHIKFGWKIIHSNGTFFVTFTCQLSGQHRFRHWNICRKMRLK